KIRRATCTEGGWANSGPGTTTPTLYISDPASLRGPTSAESFPWPLTSQETSWTIIQAKLVSGYLTSSARFCSITARVDNPWWWADLGESKTVSQIVVHIRRDGHSDSQFRSVIARLGDSLDAFQNPVFDSKNGVPVIGSIEKFSPTRPKKGRYLSLQSIVSAGYLTLYRLVEVLPPGSHGQALPSFRCCVIRLTAVGRRSKNRGRGKGRKKRGQSRGRKKEDETARPKEEDSESQEDSSEENLSEDSTTKRPVGRAVMSRPAFGTLYLEDAEESQWH
ncbi:uncharacterized protein LOC119588030, partial [Penaeus monodon]|uniref:uncharacterized protein LOC119588030 n=1 Tax=Penaeus monodon TaxID=6687 RepID=UPI0018A7A4A8